MGIWLFKRFTNTSSFKRGKETYKNNKNKKQNKTKKNAQILLFSVQLKTPVFIHLCYQGEEKCH